MPWANSGVGSLVLGRACREEPARGPKNPRAFSFRPELMARMRATWSLRRPPSVESSPQGLRNGTRIGQHRSAVAQAGQVLGGIKAVRHGRRKAGERAPGLLRTVGLAGILQENQPPPPGDGSQRYQSRTSRSLCLASLCHVSLKVKSIS